MWNPGFILIIVIAVVGMIVQARLQSVFKKYSQVMFPGGLTGREVAEKMLHDQRYLRCKGDSDPRAPDRSLQSRHEDGEPERERLQQQQRFGRRPSRRTSAAMPYSMHAIMRR